MSHASITKVLSEDTTQLIYILLNHHKILGYNLVFITQYHSHLWCNLRGAITYSNTKRSEASIVMINTQLVY